MSERYAQVMKKMSALRKAVLAFEFEYPAEGSTVPENERRSVGVGFQLIDVLSGKQPRATFGPLKKRN
ncbi:hypothetical protein HZC09_06575 [Candidatus Micrarchaeota archaeon]|nr:hypothetical protein [Candidatus Micrarchaeota archaeon]